MPTNEKKCEYCRSNKAHLAINEEGIIYQKWNSNPYKEDTWICGKCYRNLLYHNALPPIHVRRSIRMDRVAKRICFKYGDKTIAQKSKTFYT